MHPALLHYIFLAVVSHFQVTIVLFYMLKASLSLSRPSVVLLNFSVSHPCVSCT
jgi:hypothetical protein